ncbi:Glutathione S-transferase zeta-1 [Podila minutissima]|uniref:Glutathione S-transferase zeta-1 n=1 Tax=Podila minutissima TaxID=64525 RepID=A0A9P5SU36_9FUNG|nr:Glutathione S-transferase zeta-1 [Podila minutissima]
MSLVLSGEHHPHPHLPVLYAFFRSSCSWRVRLALHLKKIPYETRPVNLLTGQNKTLEYKKIQPFGAVPAFVENGHVLTQSINIIEYLEETRPVEAVAMDIQPVGTIRVLNHVSSDPAKQKEWSAHWMKQGFEAFEAMLKKTAGVYSFGDTITMADVVLVPQYYNGVRFGVDMTAYPTIWRINHTLEKEESFKLAHPSSQIDCPADFC